MRTLLDRPTLERRVAELGEEISTAYEGKTFTVVVMLNGALIFGADLVRHLPGNIRIDTFGASSYVNDRSSGELRVRSALKLDVKGEDLLLVDDIFDTGTTLGVVAEKLLAQGARSVKSCVLLDKKVPKKTAYRPDFVGFEVEDLYVVGYGLDSNELGRNLDRVAVKD